MHPILDDRRRLGFYLLAWCLLGALLAVALRGAAFWLTSLALFLPVSLAYAFVCLSAWYVCRAFPIEGGPRASRIAIGQLAAALMATLLLSAMTAGWAAALDSFAADLGAQSLYAQQWPLLLVVGALLFWLAAVFHYLLIAFELSREAERRGLELGLLARDAELKALRAQIDPHFIFNSLHSISALTTTDPAAARRMCVLLGDFLRDTLRLGSNSRITLADELALTERFLAIEQIRLGPRLQVVRETDDQAPACLVPPLLLQPLVENAIVHGVAQLVEGGTIRIAAAREGELVRITVENPCDPDRARSRGVGLGLELLRKRLVTHFGMYDAVRAAERGDAFRVEVVIPT